MCVCERVCLCVYALSVRICARAFVNIVME